jgi:hypothetical protein
MTFQAESQWYGPCHHCYSEEPVAGIGEEETAQNVSIYIHSQVVSYGKRGELTISNTSLSRSGKIDLSV